MDVFNSHMWPAPSETIFRRQGKLFLMEADRDPSPREPSTMTLLSLETSGLYSKQKETFFPSKIKLNCACVHECTQVYTLVHMQAYTLVRVHACTQVYTLVRMAWVWRTDHNLGLGALFPL